MDKDKAASIAEYDLAWRAWQMENPDGDFSDFALVRTLKVLRKGRPLPKLGANLTTGRPWEEDGLYDFKKLMIHHPFIKPDDKVLEYGCGTLRLGVHFIKSQAPSGYFGLDVSDELLDYGRALTDPLKDEKHHQVETISAGMDRAIAFGADLVVTMKVIHHVHPDEMAIFCANLRQVCHKRRSLIIVQAMISNEPLRYSKRAWANPIEYFDQHMAPFLRTKSSQISKSERDDEKFESWLLTYVPR